MINIYKKNAFTLMETVVYLGIFSSLLIVFSLLFSALIDTSYSNRANSFLNHDYNYIKTKLGNEVKSSSSILNPSVISNSSNILTIKKDSVIKIFRFRNGNLELITDNVTDKLNSSETFFKNGKFTLKGDFNGRKIIEVSGTLSSQTPSKTVDDKTFQLFLALF